MIHVLALFLISTLAGCASCSSDLKENGKENGKEEKPDTEEVRPESFASDDEMLDYIQKVHTSGKVPSPTADWHANASTWMGIIPKRTRMLSPPAAADLV